MSSSTTAEQRGFNTIGRVSRSGRKPLRPFIDRLFARGVTSVHLDRDWNSDADWALMQQSPLRARLLVYLVLVALFGFIVWASLASVDEVTRGTGRVIPSSQLQRVQSFDGGVVQRVLIDEGDRVEAGELLMHIDPTRFLSNFQENRVQAESLKARIERLRALATGTEFSPPRELVEAAPELVAEEQRVYQTSLAALQAQRLVLEERLQQRQSELDEARSRRDTAQRALGLASEELNLTRPLVQSGAASEVEILRLRREVTQAQGQREQGEAQVTRLTAAIEEAKAELQQVTAEARSEWRQDLSSALGELAALNEASSGLQDRVQMAEVRSPVDGIVQRVGINTIGGVAEPGEEVVAIVPTDDTLLIETRISPRDIAFLHPGQEATVKLTAYDFAIYGGLEAELVNISADTITDEEGNTFYLAKVRTLDGDVVKEAELDVIPGMTAQVDILTGKRTVMQYLLKPILRAWNNALSER